MLAAESVWTASPRFATALEAVLEVLPVSASPSRGFDLDQGAKGPRSRQASTSKSLEGLRRLAFSDRIDEPEQLKLWRDGGA